MEDNGSGKGIKVPNTLHFQNGGSYSMLEALVGYFLFLSDIFLKSTILKVWASKKLENSFEENKKDNFPLRYIFPL